MRYAVVINMDYATHPEWQVHWVWREICRAMILAGFRREGRLFTIDRPAKDASHLAYDTMDTLASRLEKDERQLYPYIREFYGYRLSCADNLMVPPLDGLEVREG